MVDVTQPETLRARIPANKGKRYPAQVLTPDEVRALMARCSEMSSIGIRYQVLVALSSGGEPRELDRRSSTRVQPSGVA